YRTPTVLSPLHVAQPSRCRSLLATPCCQPQKSGNWRNLEVQKPSRNLCFTVSPVRCFVRTAPVGFLPFREYNTRYSGTPLTRTTNGRTFRIPRLFRGVSQTSQIIH